MLELGEDDPTTMSAETPRVRSGTRPPPSAPRAIPATITSCQVAATSHPAPCSPAQVSGA
ncbi:hypothetical protein O1L44_00815 [Streptomyces noursei]|nr:hypothetical protein [Streptomyces noursei]